MLQSTRTDQHILQHFRHLRSCPSHLVPPFFELEARDFVRLATSQFALTMKLQLLLHLQSGGVESARVGDGQGALDVGVAGAGQVRDAQFLRDAEHGERRRVLQRDLRGKCTFWVVCIVSQFMWTV